MRLYVEQIDGLASIRLIATAQAPPKPVKNSTISREGVGWNELFGDAGVVSV
jgi:hypothetical protein